MDGAVDDVRRERPSLPLFRPEALTARSPRLEGEVLLAAPLSTRILTAAAVIVLCALVLAAALIPLPNRKLVAGRIVPEGGLVEVRSPQAGVVSRVLVSMDEEVPAGAPLLALGAEGGTLAGSLEDRLTQAITAEARSEAERQRAALAQTEAERLEILASLETLQREAAVTTERISAQQRRVKLATDELARVQGVADQGFLPRSQLYARQAQLLDAEDGLQQLRASALALKREQRSAAKRLDALAAKIAAQSATGEVEQASLAARRAEMDARLSGVLRAPRAGRVLELPYRPGQAIPAGAAGVILAPPGARNRAELLLPSNAIGFLRPGQKVRLRYDGYPYRRFGSALGTITLIARAPLPASEPAGQTDTPMFRAEVQLARQDVATPEGRFPLRPGMTLSAAVVVERRTLLGWLVEPFRRTALA